MRIRADPDPQHCKIDIQEKRSVGTGTFTHPGSRNRNYLFSAPAPPFSSSAPAIYCHLKMYYSITVAA